jgi:hypothetical protein
MIYLFKKLILLYLVAAGGVAFAGYSVDVYQENKSNELIKMYVFGLANGYLNANVYMRSTDAGPMFCANTDKNLILSRLKLPDFLRILDMEISKEGLATNKNIEKLLLQGMLKELNCENKK